MKISNIYYINLNRDIQRREAFEKNPHHLGAYRIPGRDVRDYESVSKFTEAAKIEHEFGEIKTAPGTLGALWAMRDALHTVIRSDEIAIVCHDDTHMKQPIDAYNNLLNQVPADNFKCIQLMNCENWFYRRQHPFVNHMKKQLKISEQLYENFRCAGDRMNILSPAGAKFLIDCMNHDKSRYLEGIVQDVCIPLSESGCYSVVKPNNWVGLHGGFSSTTQFLNRLSIQGSEVTP